MSAGAEPDGSSKLIALILRHPNVKKAINRMINERNGLVLGIGEGFKALLKTGLIQTGQIQEKESGDIVLAKNPGNMYHCTLKPVRIKNQTKSPWLKDMSSEIVPVSGRETNVYMSEELYKEYFKKGQIASLFSSGQDTDGNTAFPVEAMTSENGLVLGRTGLVENLKKGLYTNVFDAKESKIFENAVSYMGRSK